MTVDRCPGCGAGYNGKKCRACGFQPFAKNKEEIRILRRKISAPKIQKSAFRSLLGFLIILALIALLLPILRNWGTQLEEKEAANASIIQTAAD